MHSYIPNQHAQAIAEEGSALLAGSRVLADYRVAGGPPVATCGPGDAWKIFNATSKKQGTAWPMRARRGRVAACWLVHARRNMCMYMVYVEEKEVYKAPDRLTWIWKQAPQERYQQVGSRTKRQIAHMCILQQRQAKAHVCVLFCVLEKKIVLSLQELRAKIVVHRGCSVLSSAYCTGADKHRVRVKTWR